MKKEIHEGLNLVLHADTSYMKLYLDWKSSAKAFGVLIASMC